MSTFQEFLDNDRYAKHLGVELLEAAEGRAIARMKIGEHHLNSHNTVHGGAIFSLADVVFAAASNSHGVAAVAINVNISYLKAAFAGVLTAEAREVSLNPTLAVYEVRITGETGELIAIFQGMVYRKKQSISR